MKKFLTILIAASALVTTTLQAQTRTKTTANVNQGEFLDFGGTNFTPSDSLQVSDSIAYIIPLSHSNDISAFHTWKWKKSGAGTATVTVDFFQANDPTNFFPIKKGVAQTDYSKSYTITTDSVFVINYAADTASIQGRYLKVRFITSNTASVKGYLANRFKTYVK
jgi:hypothetical protein